MPRPSSTRSSANPTLARTSSRSTTRHEIEGRRARRSSRRLFTAGVQAESLKARAEDENALFRDFFYLMQAFMGLGLFVGIAAVGVIAFRTVVERRQQIGMLRAIGYKRSTVALSFLMESSFVTLLAIFSGMSLGHLALVLPHHAATTSPTQNAATTFRGCRSRFFGVFTYVASLLMTLDPSPSGSKHPNGRSAALRITPSPFVLRLSKDDPSSATLDPVPLALRYS